MAAINLPFAASATRRAPDADELANGYGCGDADLALFDWLAWWTTGQIAGVIAKSGLAVDDADILRLAKAIRSQAMNYVATIGGTANALSITLDPAPADWADLIGTPLHLKLAATNTGAATLAISGLAGTKPIQRPGGAALVAGDLGAGGILRAIYDGTAVQMAGLTQSQPGSTVIYATPGTFSWVCPAGVFQVRAQVWAAGGGGGGATGAANSVASAGGGGEYREGVFPVVPGTYYTVIVGAGGTFGISTPTGGGTGGTSSFGGVISAIGGSGGIAANGAIQSTAGAGGTGGSGGSISRAGIGGGGAYAIPAGFVLGQGGQSYTGSFTTTLTTGGIANGPAGQFPGGGGSGGALGGSGGAGAPGQVILTF